MLRRTKILVQNAPKFSYKLSSSTKSEKPLYTNPELESKFKKLNAKQSLNNFYAKIRPYTLSVISPILAFGKTETTVIEHYKDGFKFLGEMFAEEKFNKVLHMQLEYVQDYPAIAVLLPLTPFMVIASYLDRAAEYKKQKMDQSVQVINLSIEQNIKMLDPKNKKSVKVSNPNKLTFTFIKNNASFGSHVFGSFDFSLVEKTYKVSDLTLLENSEKLMVLGTSDGLFLYIDVKNQNERGMVLESGEFEEIFGTDILENLQRGE